MRILLPQNIFKLLSYVVANPKIHFATLNASIIKNNEEYYTWFAKQPYSPRIFRKYFNNLNCIDFPCCKECGCDLSEYVLWHDKKLCKHCSCVQAQKLKQQHLMEKYGVVNVFQLPEVREKMAATNLKKYGHEHAIEAPMIREKANNTHKQHWGSTFLASKEGRRIVRDAIIAKYGTDNVAKVPEIRQKICNTNLQRYGVERPLCNNEIYQKGVQTKLELHGVTHTWYEEARNKRIQTNRDRYGTDWATQNKTVIEKRRRNNQQQWGVDNVLQREDVKAKSKQTCLTKYGTEYYINSDEFHDHYSQRNTQRSKLEQELYNACLQLNPNIKSNVRGLIANYELDMVFGSLAVEFNGDYWHRAERVGAYYHADKTAACLNIGIRLIHVFEYEWRIKKDIIIDIIRHALGKTANKVYARCCDFCEISESTYRDFLCVNCLGDTQDNATKYFALKSKNNVVMVIGINETQITNICTLLNWCVVGGVSKLIAHIKTMLNVDCITVTNNNAKFLGTSFNKIGTKTNYTPPKIIKDKMVCTLTYNVYECGEDVYEL